MDDLTQLLESLKSKVEEKDEPATEIKEDAIKKQEEEVKESKEDKIEQEVKDKFFKTGIDGLDDLCGKGIPAGSNILIGGGPGCGKTILSLQLLLNAAKRGEKCLYMSFEESEQRLRKHMKEFGWD